MHFAMWGFVNLDKNSIFIHFGVVQDSAGKFIASEPEVKRNGSGGGAFLPFKKEGSAASDGTDSAPMAAAPPASTSSTVENGGGKKESERKARRCWSPELHKRFLQALQQLGGPHGILFSFKFSAFFLPSSKFLKNSAQSSV